MNISEEQLNKYFTQFTTKVESLFEGGEKERIVNFLMDNREKIIATPWTPNLTHGGCFRGGFLYFVLYKLTPYAININKTLPTHLQVEQNSLIKVCLLHQLSKSFIYEENDNSWEKTNRGMLYKYAQQEGLLKIGERSVFLLLENMIRLTETELEAMLIMDKDYSEDTQAKLFSSCISKIIRQANELALLDINSKQ